MKNKAKNTTMLKKTTLIPGVLGLLFLGFFMFFIITLKLKEKKVLHECNKVTSENIIKNKNFKCRAMKLDKDLGYVPSHRALKKSLLEESYVSDINCIFFIKSNWHYTVCNADFKNGVMTKNYSSGIK